MVDNNPTNNQMNQGNNPNNPIIWVVSFTAVFMAVMGGIFYSKQKEQDEFLAKPLVELSGQVVGERYVPPTKGKQSEYYFSVEDVVKGRVVVEVRDLYDPKIAKESIDALLDEHSIVHVKARNIAGNNYSAFADSVSVPRVKSQ